LSYRGTGSTGFPRPYSYNTTGGDCQGGLTAGVAEGRIQADWKTACGRVSPERCHAKAAPSEGLCDVAQEASKAQAPPQPVGPSDELLALRSREGDRAAFEVLARRYQDRLFTYSVRMIGDAHEAADLTQETLVRTFRSLGNFDPQQRFGPWLFGIAAHVCRDWLRRRARRPEYTSEAVVDVEAPRAEADDAESVEQRDRVREAVRRLPLKYREVVILHYLADMGYDDVARSLGITSAAARRRALRAREMLRRSLGAREV